ncbi:MAG: ribosome biogenesis GTPase YlqF [Corallococcus sp.]|nr:ribosome biogenesis GTPase YlqF [Corallococcus sp.]MCM1359472.1 ribosome biogenesis GTPase YlqF [Corallococcus sp.]MCM1394716.1 ribosome biogenesis GTPase YlqF [Corallococcus sp.]
MSIQWFPGHMTKALRMMEENIKIVDAVGYVLDARAPLACFNPSFEKIIGNKPCVFILNKCDLADAKKIDQWCSYFKNSNQRFVKVTATASAEAGKIVAAFDDATRFLKEKMKQKGVFRPVRCLVLGVPNCGKSTIINCLSGRKTTITGDKPGVTKGKQWVRLGNGLEMLDTPGTLWPKFDVEQLAYELCFIGSIKDDVVDLSDVSQKLLETLVNLYPQSVSERYKIETANKSAPTLFDEIAAKRGFLVRGGEIDSERCAKAILDDFRKGKLGKITLDTPV